MFSDQYKKALSSLNNLFSLVRTTSDSDSNNPLNNIFSFIGDRGSGKTSCMMSLVKLLKGGLSEKQADVYPHVARQSYYSITRIDPSFFDESHNVIELFLAGLYNDFCERSKDKYNSDSQEDEKEKTVLELFAQAQKMMFEMTKTEKDRYDALDNLQNLSAGVRLGSIIRDLVSAFFFVSEKGEWSIDSSDR